VFQVVVQLHCAKESPPPFALTFSANRTDYHTLDVQISNGLLLDVRIQDTLPVKVGGLRGQTHSIAKEIEVF